MTSVTHDESSPVGTSAAVSIVQYSDVQYSDVQYSDVQYSDVPSVVRSVVSVPTGVDVAPTTVFHHSGCHTGYRTVDPG